MKPEKQIIRFPCLFPVKVMGLNNEVFTSAVESVFCKHLNPAEYTCSTKLSAGNKYLSITITFTAQSREQLDTIYQELNSEDSVLMTL
jgi:putative lipoic acid-binding regulatory protein